MKALLTLAVISLVSTNAFAEDLTQVERSQACRNVRAIIPTGDSYGISQRDCLEKFTFEVQDRTGSITEVVLFGQTVDDLATVCTVYLLSDPTIEIAVPAPSCSLE